MAGNVAENVSALSERAHAARLRSQELRSRTAELYERHRRMLSACLITRTTLVDGGYPITPSGERALIRLSTLVGRDPAIEQAKSAIAERYGITRGEAFELLRHMSQTRNRKLRDVAHAVLQDHVRTPA
jgi:ANTAR domain